MESESMCSALSRLWIVHHYSLPSYLFYAEPFWAEEDGAAALLLRDIASDQRQLADRIGKLIVESGYELPQGAYPDYFAGLNDLSKPFLWDEMIRDEQRTIRAVEELIHRLPRASVAQATAQECLGAAKAHLDSLRETAGVGARPHP